MLEQPHGMAEESHTMFLSRRSHLHSCRCTFPVRSEPAMSMLPFGHCQGQKLHFFNVYRVPKLRPAGHPNLLPHSLLWQWLTQCSWGACTQPAAGTAALPSVAAAFGCAQCMHSLGLAPPCCTCSVCAHVPPLALLLLLILASPPNNQDLEWQRSLPCHQPLLGARAAQRPQSQTGPAWLLCPVPGMAPLPAPLGRFAGAQFLCRLWPSEGQFWKIQGGGSKQSLSSFPGTCRGLQIFCGPMTECCSLPILPGTFIWGQSSWSHDRMACLVSDCFELRTEGCWDLLDGSTTCEYPEASPQDLSVSPGRRGGKTSKSAMFGKKTQYFQLSYDLSFFPYFLAWQKILLFSLHRAILQVCVAALPSSPQGCFKSCIRSAARASPIRSWSTGGDLRAFLHVDMSEGMGGLNLAKVPSLGCSFAEAAQVQSCTGAELRALSHVFKLITFSHLYLDTFF